MILAQIHITMDDKGNISVNAPFAQTMLCYGLLEVAKDEVRKKHEEERRKAVQPATLGDLAALGGPKQ